MLPRFDPSTPRLETLQKIKATQKAHGLENRPGQAAMLTWDLPPRLSLRLVDETSILETLRALYIFHEIESLLKEQTK